MQPIYINLCRKFVKISGNLQRPKNDSCVGIPIFKKLPRLTDFMLGVDYGGIKMPRLFNLPVQSFLWLKVKLT